MRPRVQIGRDVTVVLEDADGIELQGTTRLRPGSDIDITHLSGGTAVIRRAVVWSWFVAAVGKDGPVFRGVCHWT